MDAERKESESFRELRIEGATLLVAGALLIGLLSGAFYLGRRVERAATPTVAAQPARDSVASIPERASLDRISYFDHLDGSEKGLEPARQAEPPPSGLEPDQAPPPTVQRTEPVVDAAPVTEAAQGGEISRVDAPVGQFVVQVFAGRDREAAETLVGKLAGLGYGASLRSEPEGAGELIRVRVTGYGTEDLARSAAQDLQKLGYSTWVRREDG